MLKAYVNDKRVNFCRFEEVVVMPGIFQTGAGEPAVLDGRAAARLAGVSVRTLERQAAAGEKVGRVKIGGRVVYFREQLLAWLRAKLETPAA